MVQRQTAALVITPDTAGDTPLSLGMSLTDVVRRGHALGATLVASGGAGGYVYNPTLVSGSLPPGCGPINALTGEIPGIPTSQGHYTFQVSVQDANATQAVSTFSIEVISSLSPRDVTPPPGEVGLAYSYPLRVYGATGTVTWAVVGASPVPAGISIVSHDTWAGTPTTPAGTTYTLVRATDSGSGDTLDVTLVTTIATAIAQVASSPLYEVIAGVNADIDLSDIWAGGVAPYTAVEFHNTLPDGLKVTANGKSRTAWSITGKAEQPPYGTDLLYSPVGVTITDSLGVSATLTMQIMVRNTVNSIGGALNGTPVADRAPTRINFAGPFFASVTSDPSDAGGLTINSISTVPVSLLTAGAFDAKNSTTVYRGDGRFVPGVTGAWDATSFTVSGTKVVGARVTGFAAATGTADKTTYATYAAATIGGTYNATVQGQLQAIANHAQLLSQQLKALKDAAIAHGLIGT